MRDSIIIDSSMMLAAARIIRLALEVLLCPDVRLLRKLKVCLMEACSELTKEISFYLARSDNLCL